jgi:hypothetical protein
MFTRLLCSLAVCFLTLSASPKLASASPVQYTFSGIGSGNLGGTSFNDAAFTFTLSGDSTNLIVAGPSVSVIDPLSLARIQIDGVGSVDILPATRFGFNTAANAAFFGFSGAYDLFDFALSPADAAAFDLLAAFGTVTSTSVFALHQFVDVSTTGGLLTWGSSSNVDFSVGTASAVPVPAALPLLASGLGALGFAGWQRKRKSNLAA